MTETNLIETNLDHRLKYLYDVLNQYVYERQLPNADIILSDENKSKKFATIRLGKKGKYKITVYASNLFLDNKLGDDITEYAAWKMLGCMAEIFCMEKGIHGSCKNGRYYTKEYKAVGSDYGLEFRNKRDYDNGFVSSGIKPELYRKIKDDLPRVVLNYPILKRDRFLVCPICRQTIKANENSCLICGYCNVKMVYRFTK